MSNCHKDMKGFTTILFFLLTFGAIGKTIIVDQRGKIQSLKTAVQLAQRGDTIIIKPGTYRDGNIVIEKSLVIQGESYPVLDGENKFEILTIHANNVQVRGFFFKDTGIASIEDLAAIKVLESKGLRITSNKFRFKCRYFNRSRWE